MKKFRLFLITVLSLLAVFLIGCSKKYTNESGKPAILTYTLDPNESITINKGNGINFVWESTGDSTTVVLPSGQKFKLEAKGKKDLYPDRTGVIHWTWYLNGHSESQDVQVIVNTVVVHQLYLSANPDTISPGGATTVTVSGGGLDSIVSNIAQIHGFGSFVISFPSSADISVKGYYDNGKIIEKNISIIVVAKTKTQIISGKKWYYEEIDTAHNNNWGMEQLSSCKKKMYRLFKADGAYEIHQDLTDPCIPGQPEIVGNGVWHFITNETQIILDENPDAIHDVNTLNDTIFNWQTLIPPYPLTQYREIFAGK